MNIPNTIQMTDLISVSEAANLVPYSRDHITRLARESDIVATQIARRWMVSAVSLQRFYESSRHEDIVRQQYLSKARRRDLLITEQLRLERAQIVGAVDAEASSIWYSSAVLVSGLLCGVLLHASLSSGLMNIDPTSPPVAHQLSDSVTSITQVASVGSAMTISSNSNIEINNRVATSRTRDLSLENGIVLLPLLASSTLRSEDFFSDEVEIEMLTNTEGVIRLSGSPDSPALSVLRLPVASEINLTLRAP